MKNIKNLLILAAAVTVLASCGNGNYKASPTTAPNPTTNAATGVKDAADNATNMAGDAANDIGNTAGDIARGAGDTVGDVADGAGNIANDAIKGAGDAVGVNDSNGNGQ